MSSLSLGDLSAGTNHPTTTERIAKPLVCEILRFKIRPKITSFWGFTILCTGSVGLNDSQATRKSAGEKLWTMFAKPVVAGWFVPAESVSLATLEGVRTC